jgi:hypothetical protein
MMLLTTSTAFALAGTALFAVVIFAPRRERVVPTATVSYAPPHIEGWSPQIEREAYVASYDRPPDEPLVWPQLIDASAATADAGTRIDLADALLEIDTEWSRSVLARARAEEHDEDVRARLTSGRRGPSVRPTPAYADES